MTRIYVIRHAQAEGNLYQRVHGWYNGSVTATGRRQIAALEQRFSTLHVDAAYASALRRTQQTAQAVVAPRHMELHIEPQLNEIHLGLYDDMTVGDFAYHHPTEYRQFLLCSPDWAPPGGETFTQVQQRVTAAFFRIAREHPGQTVCLFSHSDAIRCLQAALRGKHPGDTPELGKSDNTAVSCYEVKGDHFRILFENDTSHLPAELTAAGQLGARSRPPLAWFKLLNMDTDGEAFYAARRDAWQDVHGSLWGFNGPGFLAEARDQWFLDHRSVQLVMFEEQTIGLLHLATGRDAAQGIGDVPFLYLQPAWRCRGIGAQLIGQAVSVYRSMGRDRLRLRCAQDNDVAQRFYRRHGFVKVGEVPGSQSSLDLLEMPI